MIWKSSTPICSTLTPRVDVNNYGKDIKFDFIKGDIDLNETVSGFDCFIQRFSTVLLSNETPVIKYGLFELLPRSSNKTEFDKECETLANAIVSHKYSNSTPEEPNGLGYNVEQIYSISKENIQGINFLIVETKVTGINDIINIKVPLTHVEEYM